MSQQEQQTSNVFETSKLNNMRKNELVDLVMQLQQEKNELLEQKMNLLQMDERIVALERSQYLYEQYGRRESIEISGIPAAVHQNNLEDEVLKVYREAKITVHDSELTKKDIAACHRIGKRGATIVRFVNRKFAFEGLRNGKNLKGSKLYENSIYINNSFCREFAKYGFIIRRLKKEKLILGYKVKHGVYQIQTENEGDFTEISHITDFEKLGLDVKRFL